MYRIKPWEELTIQDDYMFKLIMSIKHICLSLLQEILHMEIRDIHYLETEKSMDARYQGTVSYTHLTLPTKLEV